MGATKKKRREMKLLNDAENEAPFKNAGFRQTLYS
jgi:hypothetical protein